MFSRLQRTLLWFILAAVAAGVAVGETVPWIAVDCGRLGTMFIGLLKAVAPFVVFFSVASAVAERSSSLQGRMGRLLGVFGVMMSAAAVVSVALAVVFPVMIPLDGEAVLKTAPAAREAVAGESLAAWLFSSNCLPVLAAAVATGFGARFLSLGERLQKAAASVCRAATGVVIIAPLGIFGMVAEAWAKTGVEALYTYGRLLFNSLLAVVVMLAVVLPAIYATAVRRNPYPLLCRCLRDSALTAFFTRSSIANIPVNLALCRSLKLEAGLSSMAVSLGAVINMPGATVTMATLTACAAQSVGMTMSWETMVMIATVSVVCTVAAVGVPSGALMLVPVTTGLLGMESDVAVQMMAVGMVISVLQDAAGTALNSMSDVWAALVVERSAKQGKYHFCPKKVQAKSRA